MKKEERLHRLFGDIDDDLVADAAARPIPLRVWLPRVTVAVATVALVVGAVLTQPWVGEKPPIADGGTTTTTTVQQNAPVDVPGHEEGNYSTTSPAGGTPTATGIGGETWYEPKWDEKPIWQQFPNFERAIPAGYDDKMNYCVHASNIDTALVGEYLEDVHLHGYDNYTETAYDVVGKIYRIEGINPVCAVALQYPDRSDFFPALNWSYKPDTLEEFIDDLNLQENIRIGTVYRSYRDEKGVLRDFRYSGLTAEKMWELLMSDTSVLGEDNNGQIKWNDKIILYIDVPLLGYYNNCVYLTEEGYMLLHLVNVERVFHIGEDKVDAFMEYVEENCRLQKDDELIALPGDTTHPDTTMTSSAQPPLVTGTTIWTKPDPAD